MGQRIRVDHGRHAVRQRLGQRRLGVRVATGSDHPRLHPAVGRHDLGMPGTHRVGRGAEVADHPGEPGRCTRGAQHRSSGIGLRAGADPDDTAGVLVRERRRHRQHRRDVDRLQRLHRRLRQLQADVDEVHHAAGLRRRVDEVGDLVGAERDGQVGAHVRPRRACPVSTSDPGRHVHRHHRHPREATERVLGLLAQARSPADADDPVDDHVGLPGVGRQRPCDHRRHAAPRARRRAPSRTAAPPRPRHPGAPAPPRPTARRPRCPRRRRAAAPWRRTSIPAGRRWPRRARSPPAASGRPRAAGPSAPSRPREPARPCVRCACPQVSGAADSSTTNASAKPPSWESERCTRSAPSPAPRRRRCRCSSKPRPARLLDDHLGVLPGQSRGCAERLGQRLLRGEPGRQRRHRQGRLGRGEQPLAQRRACVPAPARGGRSRRRRCPRPTINGVTRR